MSTIIKHHSVLIKRNRENGTFLAYMNIQRKYLSPPGIENTKSSGFEERDRGPSGHTAGGRWASVLSLGSFFSILMLPQWPQSGKHWRLKTFVGATREGK